MLSWVNLWLPVYIRMVAFLCCCFPCLPFSFFFSIHLSFFSSASVCFSFSPLFSFLFFSSIFFPFFLFSHFPFPFPPPNFFFLNVFFFFFLFPFSCSVSGAQPLSLWPGGDQVICCGDTERSFCVQACVCRGAEAWVPAAHAQWMGNRRLKQLPGLCWWAGSRRGCREGSWVKPPCRAQLRAWLSLFGGGNDFSVAILSAGWSNKCPASPTPDL